MNKIIYLIIILTVLLTVNTIATYAEEETEVIINDRHEIAKKLHVKAWEDVSTKALTENQYKYGIYVSRSMAVKHPEIYLQADTLFYEKIMKKENGMKALFENKTKIFNEREEFIKDLSRKKNSVKPLLWSDIEVKEFKKMNYTDLYLEQPFLDYIDIRMYGIATALQSTDMKMVPLNLAEITYFKEKIIKRNNPYIIMTQNGNAYVWSDNKLLKCDGKEAEEISEKVVLIFNDKNVWYPLMERNDTDRDYVLKKLVSLYTDEKNKLPELSDKEKELAKMLNKSTEIKDKEEEIKTKYYTSKIYTAYLRRRDFEDRDRFTVYDKEKNQMRELDTGFVYYVIAKNANYLSPVTAYYASVAKELECSNLNTLTDAVINDFHNKTNTGTDGKRTFSTLTLWTQSELVYINIDDTWLTKGSNCMYSASNAASIFELADIQDLDIIGVSMGSSDRRGGHIYLALYRNDEKRLVENFHPHGQSENGLVDFGTNIFRGFVVNQDWVLFLDEYNPKKMKTYTTKDKNWIRNILNYVDSKSESRSIMVNSINTSNGYLKGINIKDFIKKFNINNIDIYKY